MTPAPSVADVLNAAADLLEKPGAWTQTYFARTANGHAIGPCTRPAACWCAIGALRRVTDDGYFGPELELIEQVVGTHPINFNDAPNRTQSEVVAAFRKAAALAEQST